MTTGRLTKQFREVNDANNIRIEFMDDRPPLFGDVVRENLNWFILKKEDGTEEPVSRNFVLTILHRDEPLKLTEKQAKGVLDVMELQRRKGI